MHLNPYLNFNDQCEAALNFYCQILGGKLDMLMRCGESPMRNDIPEERQHQVMHAQISVGTQIIMGADISPECRASSGPGPIALTLNYDNTDEARHVFDALAAGGQVQMPFAPTFWAEGFGALTDKFGISWLVNGAYLPMPG